MNDRVVCIFTASEGEESRRKETKALQEKLEKEKAELAKQVKKNSES